MSEAEAMAMLAELVWRPMIDPGRIIALAVVLAALAVVAYALPLAGSWRSGSGRGRWLAALPLLAARLGAIGLLAALLAGPSVVPPSEEAADRPRLTVLLDTSGSMQRADVQDRPRIDHVLRRWLNREQLDALRERFGLDLRGFDVETRSLSPGALEGAGAELAQGRATNYPDPLTDALLALPRREGGGDALLVIGDGHDTERRPLAGVAELAGQRGATVHAVAVGTEENPPDLAVVAHPRQRYLMAEEEGAIRVELRQIGLAGRSATVRLTGPGGAEQRRRVELGEDPTAELELPIEHEEEGTYEYTVAAEPIAGESVTRNNEHTVFVRVTGKRIRVLMLEGEPYWDTKFLAQSLRRDQRVQLVQITQVSPEKRDRIATRVEEDREAEVPRSLEALTAYDVVILGRSVEHMLDGRTAGLLGRYVSEAGGNLIFARGRSYGLGSEAGRAVAEALGPVEPVRWGEGRMDDVPIALTAAGRSSPIFAFGSAAGSAGEVIGAQSALPVLELVEGMKPAAVALARVGRAGEDRAEPGEPAMVSMTQGRGRVVAVLGQGLWRWSLRPPGEGGPAGVFETMWSNAVRYLAMGGAFEPGEEVALRLSRASVRLGDAVRMDAVTRLEPPAGFSPTLTLTDPEGRRREVALEGAEHAPRRLSATVEPEMTGTYEARLEASPLSPAEQSRRFSVYDTNQEQLRTAARPEALRRLAAATDGLFFRAGEDEAVDLAERLHRHRVAREVPPTPEGVWDRPWLLAVLVLALGLEWMGRRLAGWL